MTARVHQWLPLLVAALAATACSPTPSNDTSPGPGSSGLAGDVSRYFSIEEIGLGPDGFVTLLNYTDQPASLNNLRLCQEDRCVELANVDVDGGSVTRIAVSDGAGLDDVGMTGADLALTPDDGEVALLRAGSATEAADIRAYLEWGSTPHGLTAAAISAGLWHAGSYAPTSPSATRLYKTEANLWVFDTP
jgi:hypothetical protein